MSNLPKLIKWSWYKLTLDWIGCFGLFYLVYLMESLAPPFESRKFLLSDKTIGNPFAVKEIVPVKALFWLALGLPIIIIILSYFKVKNWKFVHIGIIGLFFNLTLGIFIVQLLKNLVGRLRPDFIDRCKPTEESLTSTILLGIEICTQQNNWIMRDGSQSFPSGHAANTFGSLLFLALYFNQILKLSNNQSKINQYYCFIFPLSISLFVAISRILDFRHHWEDVLVGSLIGIFTALFSYFYYFKKLIKFNEEVNNDYKLINDEKCLIN